MHVQPGISRLSLAVLAGGVIAIEHTGTDVAKAALRTILIFNACNLGILQTLDVKPGFLIDDACPGCQEKYQEKYQEECLEECLDGLCRDDVPQGPVFKAQDR